jgi:hypothetical protein
LASIENWNAEKSIIRAAPSFMEGEALFPLGRFLVIGGPMRDFSLFVPRKQVSFRISDEPIEIFLVGRTNNASRRLIDQNYGWEHAFVSAALLA